MGRTKRRRNLRVRREFDEESHENIVGLLRWMRLKKNHLKVSNFIDTGRGVFSRCRINAGEELIAIPLDCMITMNDVKGSQISEILMELLHKPQVALALFLLYENHIGNSSKYYAYINVLPKTYDTLLYCSEHELHALPSWIELLVRSSIAEVKQDVTASKRVAEGFRCCHCDCNLEDIITYETFLWAWSTTNTRCVYFKDDEISGEECGNLALAPFVDLFNHSNEADVEVQLDCQRGVYILKTNKPYQKYEQIFIKYGAHSNLRLLTEYGFIIKDDLDQDAVEFSFEDVLTAARIVDSRFGDITKLKYKFIRTNNLNINLSKTTDEFSWSVNGLLYILTTQDSDLVKLLSKTYSSTWSEEEEELMEEIKQILQERKSAELMKQLLVMTEIEECSIVFGQARDLVRNYIQIVEA